MNVYYVIHVDLKGSSNLRGPAAGRAGVSQIGENLFRFFLQNEGVGDDLCMWAGDGGFAMLDASRYSASQSLRIADWFGAYVEHFLNSEYTGIEGLGKLLFRICIAQVTAALAPGELQRLSNSSGNRLNLFIKNERKFGFAGHISIWEDVHAELLPREQARFAPRPRRVKGIRVYDASIRNAAQAQPLASITLAAKDSIDRKSLRHFGEELAKTYRGETDVFRAVVAEVFTPNQLCEEIVQHVHASLAKHYQGTEFRVAYAKLKGERLIIDQVATRRPRDVYHPIDVSGRYTAALAFRRAEPEYVASTAEELRKPKGERRFNLTHNDQDTNRLASILCLPVISELKQGREKKSVHGVLCVDTPVDRFFSDQVSRPLIDTLGTFTTELALAEMFDELLKVGRTPDKKRSPHGGQ